MGITNNGSNEHGLDGDMMNGWMDGRMDGWMIEYIDKLVDE
jgi:hypothetical protein